MATTAKDIIKATGCSEDKLIAMFLEASVSVPFSMMGDPKGEKAGSFESTFDGMVKARKTEKTKKAGKK